MPNSGNEQLVTSPVAITKQITSPQESQSSPDTEEFYDGKKAEAVELKTLDEYLSWKKESYLNTYFELGDYGKMPSVKSAVDNIESFVRSEMERLKLDDNLESVDDILAELNMKLGINPNEIASSRIQKLSRWIKYVLLPSRKLEEKKRRILGDV